MCCATPHVFVRRFATQAASSSVSSKVPRDLRGLRDLNVQEAQERVFGQKKLMPGDRYFRKPLEGKKLMRWYFPSKFNLQDFRVDEYFEMQGERFSPRKPHPSLSALQKAVKGVSWYREELRTFFLQMDEATFRANPSLQDLYSVFRLVHPDKVLIFEVCEKIFREHSPLFHKPSSVQTEDLCQFFVRIEAKLDERGRDELRARIKVSQSDAEIREILLKEERLHVVPSFNSPTVAGDSSEVDSPDEWSRFELHEPRNKSEMADLEKYLGIRHRFVDPMYRRRRLKWLERQMAEKNKPKEVQHNSYYATHADDSEMWPTNKGSVTVKWPGLYHLT
eukprot:TRINITY_DN56007_c0_g1_i1.p1 TRINITY_DN56007_c0_g1~~TRINITY_DN56007_c0_g1_i1.p1  ORF type:complete len:335 (-),score=50.57 TRINITY_DN56007_c0_g1_i1:187-1191(-)